MTQTEPIVYKCPYCGYVRPELIASREHVKGWATSKMVDVVICTECGHILGIIKP